MKLPTELVLKIIHDLVDTPAVFIFDVDLGETPHPPLFRHSGHIRFQPLLSPPTDHQGHNYPGTYESLVSKTIRSLLLTSKWVRAECLKRLQGIKVPTVSRHAIVRFNPKKHIICLYNIRPRSQYFPIPTTTRRLHDLEIWVRQESDLLTDIDFDIEHLAFMAESGGGQTSLDFLRTVFPGLRHIYSVVTEIPRKSPSESIEVICPARDPTHMLSPMFLYMAAQSWNHTRKTLFYRGRGGDGPSRNDWLYDFEFGELVLI